MWQSLLRNWVWQTVKSAATQATVSSSSGAESTSLSTDVGFVFALPQESNALADRLSGLKTTHGAGFKARSGVLAGRRVVVIDGGAGRQAAARAADALIIAHRPRLVISAGFAGGLIEPLKRGHIVMADELRDEQGTRLSIELKFDRSALTPSLQMGPLVTIDRIVRTPADKRKLQAETGAIAVDMETIAVAEVCRTLTTPFMAVRIISDAVDDELPKAVDKLIRKKSLAGRLGIAAAAITRKPSTVKDLWMLKENAIEQSERLANFLAQMIAQLPERTGGAA